MVTGMALCDSSQYDMTRNTPQRYNIVIRKRGTLLALRKFKDKDYKSVALIGIKCHFCSDKK